MATVLAVNPTPQQESESKYIYNFVHRKETNSFSGEDTLLEEENLTPNEESLTYEKNLLYEDEHEDLITNDVYGGFYNRDPLALHDAAAVFAKAWVDYCYHVDQFTSTPIFVIEDPEKYFSTVVDGVRELKIEVTVDDLARALSAEEGFCIFWSYGGVQCSIKMGCRPFTIKRNAMDWYTSLEVEIHIPKWDFHEEFPLL